MKIPALLTSCMCLILFSGCASQPARTKPDKAAGNFAYSACLYYVYKRLPPGEETVTRYIGEEMYRFRRQSSLTTEQLNDLEYTAKQYAKNTPPSLAIGGCEKFRSNL